MHCLAVSTSLVKGKYRDKPVNEYVFCFCVQDCSDEVVPFSLDEEFDYDTVVYTPKFSQAEMNYLTSFLPQSS